MRNGSSFQIPRSGLLGVAALLMSSSLFADVLDGANDFLCYGLRATVCTIDGDECETMEPWKLNLPDFVNVDLRAKQITSTNAAVEQRETAIGRLERADGLIVMQGLQNGRAFSWVIAEATGEGTITINTSDTGTTVFTVCTPT